MNAVIVSVGTEYLLGTIPEPNAEYLAGRVTELGLELHSRMVVGGEPVRVKEALDYAYAHASMVIMTGAVGVQKNPAVNELLADYFGKKLKADPKIRQHITAFEKQQKKEYPKAEKEELCRVPEDALVFVNDLGITPGYVLDENGKILIVLPGSRKEMEEIFENDAVGYIFKVAAAGRAEMVIQLVPESASLSVKELQKKLGEWGTYDNPEITFAKTPDGIQIRIRAIGPTKGDARILVRIAGTNVSQRIGDNLVLKVSESP